VTDTSTKFDYLSFFRDLDTTRAAKSLTWKDVSKETGVSQSTLTRLSQGRGLDAGGLATLAAWAGLDTDRYVEIEKADAEPLALLTSAIARDQRLSPEGKIALEEMVKITYGRLVQNNQRTKKKN
jgi:transcriptional regulator with XRE-family HTH domain